MVPGLEKEQRLPRGPSEKKQKGNLFRTLSERELSCSHLSSCSIPKKTQISRECLNSLAGQGTPSGRKRAHKMGQVSFKRGNQAPQDEKRCWAGRNASHSGRRKMRGRGRGRRKQPLHSFPRTAVTNYHKQVA